MIKNIIFDIGGVMFNEGTPIVSKALNENAEDLCKRVYGKSFKECVLGNLEVSDYIETFKDDEDYNKIKYILAKENLSTFYPLMKDNFDYISKLKDKGYNLYILSNITRESFEYVNSTIDIDKYFVGGVYSFKEKLKKPDKRIFELIVDRYNLNKEETLFFDDKQKNIDAACEFGLKGVLFRSVKDIEDNLMNHFEYTIYDEVYRDMVALKKNIEFRLLNEKSKSIKIGDEILFKVNNEDKNLLVEVTNKYIYDDVDDLWSNKDVLNNVLNYSKDDFTNALYSIFGKDNVINSKIVGIEFKIKDNL